MSIQEKVYFLRQLQHSYTSIGALIPTSRYAARAMASECARRAGPRRILEVGPGTGSITAAIIESMRPDDQLVLCELNADFVAYLRRRLATDPAFQRVSDRVTLLHMDVTQLDRSQRFDCIISAIPFTNCPPELIQSIFECYREILAPDGVLTYIEYAYLRPIKQRVLFGAPRRELESASAVIEPYLQRYQFRRDLVYRNVPPAWVRHLRFEEPPASAALALAPLEHDRRIPLGASANLSTEALPWLLGLLIASLLRPLSRVRALLWLIAAAVAAFFRDPARRVKSDPDLAYAACDGRVLSVEQLRDERFGDEEWLRVAVFLSLANVHINRSPVAGRVERVLYESGGYAPADSPVAEHNRAVYTLIEGAAHGRCVVAQRAGLVARRIVNWVKPGVLLAQGDRYGLIRFGSRTDVYLPAQRFEACVAPGDRVRGGETVIARYNEN
jgi:phosphatidylserine decarboxylase